MHAPRESGFTIVELLVTIVIAVLILSAGSQAYSVALTSAGTSQRRAKASNMAYDLLRQAQMTASTPCVAAAETTIPLPDLTALPGATATKTVTCPFGSSSDTLSLIVITVTYNNPETRSITRAIISGS